MAVFLMRFNSTKCVIVICERTFTSGLRCLIPVHVGIKDSSAKNAHNNASFRLYIVFKQSSVKFLYGCYQYLSECVNQRAQMGVEYVFYSPAARQSQIFPEHSLIE